MMLTPLHYLSIIFMATSLLLIDHLPIWVLSSVFILAISGVFRKLSNKLINLMMLVLVTIVSFYFKHSINPESMLSLFLIIGALKFNQIKSYRDFLITLLCLLFCITGVSLFEKSIIAMVYSLSSIIVLTSFIGKEDIFVPNPGVLKANIRKSIKLILIASPIAIILFVFFPRVKSFFPSLGDIKKGNIGYSSIMNNSSSSLEPSSEIAFRVKLKKQLPMEKLYWRGRVLNYTDGYNWTRRSNQRLTTASKKVISSASVTQYEITLEKHFNGDLFVLDTPTGIQSAMAGIKTSKEKDHFYSRSNKKSNFRYQVSSNTNLLETYMNGIEKYLRLPQKLAKKIFINIKDKKSLLSIENSLRNYFILNEFSYSLSPGRIYDIEDFIESKVGYCTHYASLTAIALKQNGIPSRVISGFQGGEYNEFGDYYIVRSNDAHAWVEAYINNKWQRVDPTGYISPDRIILGGHKFNTPLLQSFQRNYISGGKIFKFYNKFKFYFDSLNVRFNQFFDDFNRDYQKKIAKHLGLRLETFYMMAIWLLLLIVLTIFILQARKRHLKVMSDMTRIENQLRVRVKRNMANYNRSMTLTEIKTQLIKRNIAKEEEIKKIFESLINYKYSDQQIDLSSIDILIKKILP